MKTGDVAVAAPAASAKPPDPLKPAPPATLVIFGITGDLSHRLLMPALINMTAAGLVDDRLTIIGIGHDEVDDASLRRSFEPKPSEDGGPDDRSAQAWRLLSPRLSYLRGDFADPGLYRQLSTHLSERLNAQPGDRPHNHPAGSDGEARNVVFYLATAPVFFGDITDHLADAGLFDESAGFRRVAIEKPFGHDLASAQALNRRILGRIAEHQIYRLDHFLGKETVQNIMVARFANILIEAVWNSHYIDHVQITAAETVDVGHRGAYYDAAGALRDMVPNHLFQLLAMVCMEPPNSFDAESIRNEKAKVFQAIRGPRGGDLAADVVRGVYRAGRIAAGQVAGHPVTDYAAAPDVAPGSRTETYVALKIQVDSWRWAGVPFYLRTGKALSHRDTEVVVVFKPVPFAQFAGTDVTRLPPNRMVMQIQPDEGIAIDFTTKRPGPAIDTAAVKMRFRYADLFDVSRTTGYETLLYDLLVGDQTLFQRADGIEAAWRAVQPILDAWAASDESPQPYAAGSDGPALANELIERDGRQWHALGT